MSTLQKQTVLNNDEGIQAFQRLEKARMEIRNYFPENFDPEKELEEARKEHFGSKGISLERI